MFDAQRAQKPGIEIADITKMGMHDLGAKPTEILMEPKQLREPLGAFQTPLPDSAQPRLVAQTMEVRESELIKILILFAYDVAFDRSGQVLYQIEHPGVCSLQPNRIAMDHPNWRLYIQRESQREMPT